MTENTPQHRAKRPRTILAGPYGHPFHPILVTIPIGAWVASLIFDIIAIVSDDPAPYARAAWILIVIGLIGAVAAAVAGLLDYAQLARGTTARRTATTHMAINLAVTAMYVANLLIRLSLGEDDVSAWGVALSVIALAALGASGWLGGKLAYRYGVRVADERTQAEGFR